MRQDDRLNTLFRYLAITALVGCSSPQKAPSATESGEFLAQAAKWGCPSDMQNLPLTPMNWEVAYSGYGHIEISPRTNEIYFSPEVARAPQSTHAALVLSRATFSGVQSSIYVEYQNLRALREDARPNPWEVFWLFFQYRGTKPMTKETNYVVVKPTGFEVGRAFGSEGQAFVATSENPRLNDSEWHSLRVDRRGHAGRIHFDGQLVREWRARDQEDRELFAHDGKIGLYTEDAEVIVRRVCVGN